VDYRNNAGRLGAGFISVCLETRLLGQKRGFYVPERPFKALSNSGACWQIEHTSMWSSPTPQAIKLFSFVLTYLFYFLWNPPTCAHIQVICSHAKHIDKTEVSKSKSQEKVVYSVS